MKRSTFDPCLSYEINPDNQHACLAFGAHVDDLLICNDRTEKSTSGATNWQSFAIQRRGATPVQICAK